MCAGGGGSRCEWILQALMWAMVCSFGLADLVDALVGLLGGFAQFAVGGFLCGVIIPLPMYPLSAIHPEGSIPSSSPEGAWCGHVVHGAGVGIRPTRACRWAGPGSEAFMPVVLCSPRPWFAVSAPTPAGEEVAVQHDSRSPRAPPPR